MTIPVLTQWVANAVVVLLFPLAFSPPRQIGHIWLSCINGLVASSLHVPETKNESLEKIEKFWRLPAH